MCGRGRYQTLNAPDNKSLDASGVSVFRNLLSAAEGASIRAAASTQTFAHANDCVYWTKTFVVLKTYLRICVSEQLVEADTPSRLSAKAQGEWCGALRFAPRPRALVRSSWPRQWLRRDARMRLNSSRSRASLFQKPQTNARPSHAARLFGGSVVSLSV